MSEAFCMHLKFGIERMVYMYDVGAGMVIMLVFVDSIRNAK